MEGEVEFTLLVNVEVRGSIDLMMGKDAHLTKNQASPLLFFFFKVCTVFTWCS